MSTAIHSPSHPQSAFDFVIPDADELSDGETAACGSYSDESFAAAEAAEAGDEQFDAEQAEQAEQSDRTSHPSTIPFPGTDAEAVVSVADAETSGIDGKASESETAGDLPSISAIDTSAPIQAAGDASSPGAPATDALPSTGNAGQPWDGGGSEGGGSEGTGSEGAGSSGFADYRRRCQAYMSAVDAWREQRRDAEHAHSQAGLEMARAQARLKTCREIFKDATEVLLGIDASEPAPPASGKATFTPATVPHAAVPLAAADDATAPAPAATADSTIPDVPPIDGPNPSAWRAAPTLQLDLAGVPRLGPKKLEALYAACPTIGDLEDLRAKGIGKGLGLRSIKGIGEEAAQAIEDKTLAWLTENRDKAVFAGIERLRNAGLDGWDGVDDPEAEIKEMRGGDDEVGDAVEFLADALNAVGPEVFAGETDADEDQGQPRDSNAGHNAARATKIEDRASELLHEQRSAEEAGDGSEPLQPQCDTDSYWQAGVEAFDRGLPVGECPWVGVAKDDWLRGWLTAKLDEEEGQGGAE